MSTERKSFCHQMLLITLNRYHLHQMNLFLKKILSWKRSLSVILQWLFSFLKMLIYQCTKTMCLGLRIIHKAFLIPVEHIKSPFNLHPAAKQVHPLIFHMFLLLIFFLYPKLQIERRQQKGKNRSPFATSTPEKQRLTMEKQHRLEKENLKRQKKNPKRV